MRFVNKPKNTNTSHPTREETQNAKRVSLFWPTK